MAVPKKRTSGTKQGMRRSHLALKSAATIACPNCGKPSRPHNVCINCGFYKGVKILKV